VKGTQALLPAEEPLYSGKVFFARECVLSVFCDALARVHLIVQNQFIFWPSVIAYS